MIWNCSEVTSVVLYEQRQTLRNSKLSDKFLEIRSLETRGTNFMCLPKWPRNVLSCNEDRKSSRNFEK